jgi:C2 domain of PTEN tumour-suppressor protein
VDYEVEILDDQVLTFSFPGSPSPPLGLLLKLLVSMESWLKADDRNVAVVHCLTGKGRTSMVLAAFLCWMGQAQFNDIYEALEYIAACKQITVDELTIPSQRRYASYFKNMLDGVRPSQPPLMLRRIIMSEAPRFAKGPPRSPQKGDEGDKKSKPGEDDGTQLLGCVPYLQIFKAGKLLHTVPASLFFQQAGNELPFCQVADGNISFHVNLVVQGDILVRARHLTPNKKRVSMFRAAFHTGYAPPNVMRLTKAQLDGACSDDRFVPDFFLDFIFEPVDAEEASKLMSEGDEEAPSGSADTPGTGKRANAVQASADDTMLHRDSRFWEVIAARMKENAADTDKKEDPMWGPTVGRRRDFSVKEGEDGQNETNKAESEQERNALETFSIGGEFDFLPEIVEPEPSQPPLSPEPARKAAPKKDSLLEALMGALDDNSEMEQEVVVFESDETPKEPDSSTGVLPNTKDEPSSTLAVEAENAGVSNESTNSKDTDASTSVKEVASKASSVDDMQALLADANMNLDDDMDALLAGDGLSDDDLLNLDMDDAELEDLESFLSPTSKS